MNSAAEDILSPSLLCLEGDFDRQVENILHHVRLTANEVHKLRYLFHDLELALQNLSPGIQVMPFGSIVTGLGIKTSDVDCFIGVPDRAWCDGNIVIQARNILRRHPRKFTNIFAITSAKVPIVKFLHIPTNYNSDVNFKSLAGVQNSELIRVLLRADPSERILRLAILIKYWSKVHKITGTNLLASYALILMVLFYLQTVNILPPIRDMQASVRPFIVDSWNTAFARNYKITREFTETLYDLLGGFFKFYSDLNFDENVISPYVGYLINKNLFKTLETIPEEFSMFTQILIRNGCKPLKLDSPMCIQDPFEHARNSSTGVHRRLAERIKAHFKFAAKQFQELPPERFLKAILLEDPTNTTPPSKPKQKHVSRNKVMKTQQRKRGLHNNFNLMKCYDKIKNIRKD